MFQNLIFALVFNAPTIIGVTFLGWSIPEILMIFWLENIIAGIFCYLKMWRVKKFLKNEKMSASIQDEPPQAKLGQKSSKANSGVSSETSVESAIDTAENTIDKWKTNYGAFTIGHGVFVILIAGLFWGFNYQNIQSLGAAVLWLLIDYAVAFKLGFLDKKMYQKVTVEILASLSQIRLGILHLSLIFGLMGAVFGKSNLYWFAAILMLLKMLSEIFLSKVPQPKS